MNARLSGEVALITGSGSGMGNETARLFAREGAKVAVADINFNAAEQTVRQIEAEGGAARAFRLDVSSEKSVVECFEAAAGGLGQISILINNAGIPGANKKADETSEAEWNLVMDINAKGVFFCTKHAVPQMRARGYGAIVNVSSIYGLVGSGELSAYHASKGAVTMMTKQDAISFAREGIRVNSVHPGTIMTPLVYSRFEGDAKGLADYEQIMASKHPIGHAGEPIDVAYAVLFLASREAKFVTGASLAVDGGYTAW